MTADDKRSEQVAREVARLFEKLGVIRAALKMMQAGVEVARIIERLDDIQPPNNHAFRNKKSVRMEEVQSFFQAEERAIKEAADHAMTLLLTRLKDE